MVVFHHKDMNLIKTYKIANRKKGQVTFGSRPGGVWEFEASDKESGKWNKSMKVRGGKEIAEKIATVAHESWLRTAGKGLEAHNRIDARARRKIDYLTGLRTLKDWKGEPEWWTNCVPVGAPKLEGISAEDLEIQQDEAQEQLEQALSVESVVA